MTYYSAWVPETTKFEHPCALFITGTTGSGKSRFIANTIEHGGITGQIEHIFYFMPRMEPLSLVPLEHQKLHKYQGIPTQYWLDNTFEPEYQNNSIIVVDDQWTEACNSDIARLLLTYSRRHLNVSLIFVSHSFFEKGPFSIIMR